MVTHARAVVVGGGAVGCSIAYHLCKAGWTDTVLLERDELTAGSTWHAAGLLPLFNMSYATSHIHDYSVKFYQDLAGETGMDTGFFRVGNLRMAQTEARMDEYRLYASTAETVGIPYEWLTPKEIAERWPLVRTEDLKGAIFHPTDGYINPADVTQAMAAGARARGARIYRKTQVDAFERTASGEWIVRGHIVADKGGILQAKQPFEIRCDVVVTATGNHAQRTAAMVGCYIPAIPVEHQYIVTEPDPALVEWRASNPQHPVLRDADAKWYVREERGGWILGPYERNAPAWAVFGVPETFRADLLQLDLDRIEAEYLSMIHRIPSTENVGLKDDFNGPICYTPDGNPLVGPAPGVDNFYFAEGFSFGITAAGGTGYYLAQMITQGEAEIDMWSLDPRRYGPWINRNYAARKNEECYEHVFILHHPDEEREACRPLKTAPCYDRVKARGAQFGQVNGWERPTYYADTPDFDDHAARSFRRGGWWRFAEAEARAVREGVGLFDVTPFAKHRIMGPGATDFLDRLTCNRLPKVGRINLTYALTEAAGTVRSEFTIVRHGENDYYVVSAGAAEAYDGDYLRKMAPADGSVVIQNVTTQYGVFAIAGPKAREVMEAVTFAQDPAAVYTNKAFPWLSAREVDLGMCRTLAIRVAYAGELGWELHHPMEMQNYLFDRIVAAGQGLRLCGTRAMNWLRQEKSYRAFGSDLGRDATPFESGLDRFVDMSKDFVGKTALETAGIRARCVTLLIDGPADADPWGREALYESDGTTRVGRLTSGGWSVVFGRQIGLGYVDPAHAAPGTRLKVRIMGALWDAEVVEDSPHDPQNLRIRADSPARR
ncbi:GcvT family protein [Futiania mangrovi]|uniref:FAD-dependent oxidoreductase n=1 Tax=Futiania mangrovi TaxID=2959716 RepID=A0A9J6P7P3_9PROT|nr:FAD-dependent oxidoreductase [Futiania mangrovii]MCP1334932.1 FAD-dependent oxidoreductase [Futiania mangrovii]